MSCVSLSCGRLSSLGTKGFQWSVLSYLSSHGGKGGKRTGAAGWPRSRFVGLDKLFSLFPIIERYSNEFSQGYKYPGSYSLLLGTC